MAKRWIPNLLTISNLIAGVMAILLSIGGQWIPAVTLIIGAALFDSIEGRLVRRLNATSEFGKELDLLADLISFGVAPATIAWLLHFYVLGSSGCFFAALFPTAGALRLARFNISSFGGHYQGLPITVAGPLLALIAVFGNEIALEWHGLLLIALVAAMVSTVKIPRVWLKR